MRRLCDTVTLISSFSTFGSIVVVVVVIVVVVVVVVETSII